MQEMTPGPGMPRTPLMIPEPPRVTEITTEYTMALPVATRNQIEEMLEPLIMESIYTANVQLSPPEINQLRSDIASGMDMRVATASATRGTITAVTLII